MGVLARAQSVLVGGDDEARALGELEALLTLHFAAVVLIAVGNLGVEVTKSMSAIIC